MAHDIRYDRRALADLRNIHAYIAESNPAAARRVIASIRTSIGYLADNPLMGVAERAGHGRRTAGHFDKNRNMRKINALTPCSRLSTGAAPCRNPAPGP